MKRKTIFGVIFIVFILFSISTVSANDGPVDMLNDASDVELNQDLNVQTISSNCYDNNQNLKAQPISDCSDELQKSDDDLKLSEGGSTSFKQLCEDLNESGGEFNLTHSYKHDESDEENTAVFYMENLVINGNNNIIDSCGSNFNFKFSSEANITINDLTFTNFNKSLFVISDSKLTFNNVNFTNCSSNLSLLSIMFPSNLTINNCNFYSNSFKNYLDGPFNKLEIYNSNFDGTNCLDSAIKENRGQLVIENSNFENFTGVHGSIINYKGDYFSIKNSKFINSNSNFTGGAIIVKYFPIAYEEGDSFVYRHSNDMLIENCTFYNLSSSSNGGAIHLDLDSGSEGIKETLIVRDSIFTDCHSKFGGAISILGGYLNISDSNFQNNSASFEGGAIYSSWTNANIAGCSFTANEGSQNAGALYFDKGKLTINDCSFIDNKALKERERTANAIYAHDVAAYFSNSTFDNGGVSVYADFASDSKIENVDKNDDIFLMDNHDYIVSVESKGIKLNLTGNEINVDSLPSRFDARDWGWTTPEKFQGDNTDCWAFASISSLETSFAKASGVLYNLSQNYLQKLQLKYFYSGDKRNSLTGFSYSGPGYALSWYGVLPVDNGYDDRGMIADTDLEDERIHVQDVLFIDTGRDDAVELIKWAILKYGAVTVQRGINGPYGELPTEGDDIAIMSHGTHFISLIGWDDNYFELDEGDDNPLNKFAWITKDSLSGFSTASYTTFDDIDNYAIVPQRAAVAYIFENDIDYHVNYQTDLTGLVGFDANYSYYSNEFVSKYDEFIGAVGTYFNESGIDYSFDVYLNGEKMLSQNGVSEFAGFRTIKLDEYIPIKAEDVFKVVFKSNSIPFQAYSRQHYIEGMSLVSADGESWSDLAPLNKTVCLKAYTVKEDKEATPSRASTKIDCSNMTTTAVASADGRVGEYFVVTLKDENGTVLANKEIKIGFNGRVYDRTTDENGSAKLQINLAYKGTYTFAIGFLGDEDYLGAFEVAKISVSKQSPKIITASKSYKSGAKTKSLTASFKSVNGNPVSCKKITFTVNGKTYTAKTNSNGVATVKVSLNKKGTYSFTVKYAGDDTFAAVTTKAKLTIK